MSDYSIWVGFDPREAAAFAVARSTAVANAPTMAPVQGLVLSQLKKNDLYVRPTEWRMGTDRPVMWDAISDAAMSTEHANARFLVPYLAKFGWALFMDGDMLVRAPMDDLFGSLDPKYAVYCVKHGHTPTSTIKMDGQVQSAYSRKNWSSFVIFNCDHPSNQRLTLDLVNSVPGRDLHRFCWLEDDEIGELDPAWNFLVGHSSPSIEPKVVHFTDGVPDMPGYENVPYADEWRAHRDAWAADECLG